MSYTDDKIASIKTSFNAYSTASIGRCIGTAPIISISGLGGRLSDSELNIDTTLYTGNYTTTISSEPIYSYRFLVTDEDGNIV
jgi:hypothetical protein